METVDDYNTYLDTESINRYDVVNDDVNADSAAQIYTDDLSDENINDLYLKLSSKKDKLRFLLLYELTNHDARAEELDTMVSHVDLIKKQLHRYQWKACGFHIEDDEWLLTDNFNDEFVKDDNIRYLINTVPRAYADDDDTILFADLMLRRLSQLCPKAKISFSIKDDKNASWILLKIDLNK